MSGFSPEELAAISDEGLVEAILQVVWASSAGLEAETQVQILDESPEGFGIVHSVWLLDAEIQNGGFHQYFWNHKHEHVPMTRRSLTRLGASQHLAVFDEALAALEREPLRTAAGTPEGVLEAFSESALASPMGGLDSRWYDLPGVDRILVSFIREHPESVWEED